MAILVFGLFGLGYWMRTLDYYDPWYQRAPSLHISLGVGFIVLLGIRLAWRLLNRAPQPLSTSAWERRAAAAVHILLIGLLLVMAATGYLYATAGGKQILVFGDFELRPLFVSKPIADLMGEFHEWAAYSIVAMALLHAAAALKHHFLDRDDTLRRMLRSAPAILPSQTAAKENEDK